MRSRGPLARASPEAIPNFATWQTSATDRRVSGVVAGVMIALALSALVFGFNPGPVVPPVLPLLMGSVIITELMSAYLLLSQFLELRYPALAYVGAAYLLSGLLVVPYLLTFPKVFSPTGLFNANEQTAVVLWALWHIGFPLLSFTYAIAQRRFGATQWPPMRTRRFALSIVATCVTIATTALFVTTHFRASLPILVQNGNFTELTTGMLLPAICVVDVAALLALTSIRRGLTVIPMWLSLAIVASLFDSAIGVLCDRYSYGWYAGKIFAVASSTFVLGAFVTEFLGLNRKISHVNAELQRLSELERQQAQERVEFLVYHDALTGLNNRARLQERITGNIDAAARHGVQVALLIVNLDHFTDVNHALGHVIGDGVLVEAAQRLRRVVRTEESVARLGGDEFAVIATDLTAASDAEPLAIRLRAALKEPFSGGDGSMHLSASVGMAIFPDDGKSAEVLLDRAQAAVLRAKRAGGDIQLFYNHAIGEQIRSHQMIQEGLRRAITGDEFVLHYQPLLNLHSGQIESAEALIRWNDPVNGLISPCDFIPIAEQTGLMVPIGRWVLETALRQARQWRNGAAPIRIAVNVSTKQFEDPSFFQHLVATLNDTQTEPEMLELEVTESVAMADATGNAVLNQCKQIGVHLSLDDFGTHYSSLSYLKRLPVDTIKIDRSFVQGLPFNKDDSAIVQAIIALGRALSRRIVAEGIEEVDQLNWLRQAGCDAAQGYLIAKPMEASAWDSWRSAWQSKGGAPLRRSI